MPIIQVSDRTKQMIDRFVAEGRAADIADCVADAMLVYAEQTNAFEDDTAYIIAQAERGIADVEAGRFTTISASEEAESFWSAMSARVDKRISDLRRSNPPAGDSGMPQKTA